MSNQKPARNVEGGLSPAGTYDYIIVGAGSAGWVVANRLSANPERRVLLVDIGPRENAIFIPTRSSNATLAANPGLAWHFPLGTDSPADACVSWKVIGRTRSSPEVISSRGCVTDYDEWAGPGSTTWSAAVMRRCMKEIEEHTQGSGNLRGDFGPTLGRAPYAPHPTTELLIEAAVQTGIPRDELNPGNVTGVGYLPKMNRGLGSAIETALFLPVRRRRNLDVLTNIEVERVLFDGRRARGILSRRAGRNQWYECRSEVILCAGALMSPKILQLSGIGPGHRLQNAGVPVIHANPNVGANLRQHLGITLGWRLRGLPRHRSERRCWRFCPNVLRNYIHKHRIASHGPFEAGGYFKARAAAARADTVFALSPFTFDCDETLSMPAPYGAGTGPGFSISGYVARPESRGEVWITSPEARGKLQVWPNWLSSQYDQATNVALVRTFRRIASQAAIRPYLVDETVPGCEVRSDEALLGTIKRLFMPAAEATGTCGLGPQDSAVVDNHLRVWGVDALRVVDLSVAPTPVSGAPARRLWPSGGWPPN